MSSIIEFLEARITEDEAIARAAAESSSGDTYDGPSDPVGPAWEASDGMVLGGRNSKGRTLALWDCEGSATLQMNPAAATHAARYDPERVLAECAAKRAILAAHQNQGDNDDGSAWIVASEILLHTLAAIYADHPDYQQEWAV